MGCDPRDLLALLTGCIFDILTTGHQSEFLDQFDKPDEFAFQRQVVADTEAAYRTIVRQLRSIEDDIEKARSEPKRRANMREMAGEHPQNLFIEYKNLSRLIDAAYERKFQESGAGKGSKRLRSATQTIETTETPEGDEPMKDAAMNEVEVVED